MLSLGGLACFSPHSSLSCSASTVVKACGFFLGYEPSSSAHGSLSILNIALEVFLKWESSHMFVVVRLHVKG